MWCSCQAYGYGISWCLRVFLEKPDVRVSVFRLSCFLFESSLITFHLWCKYSHLKIYYCILKTWYAHFVILQLFEVSSLATVRKSTLEFLHLLSLRQLLLETPRSSVWDLLFKNDCQLVIFNFESILLFVMLLVSI